jgi:hypothetical protein
MAKWTQAEETILRETWGTRPSADIVALLGGSRTVIALRAKASSLGLRRPSPDINNAAYVAKAAHRLFNKVHINPVTKCWEWTGFKDENGYGRFGFGGGGKTESAHRMSFWLYYRHWPAEHTDHLCRNPGCISPFHLEAVSPGENVRRGNVGKHLAARTHCYYGHPFSGDNLRVDQKGKRICRTCRNERARKHTAQWSPEQRQRRCEYDREYRTRREAQKIAA